MNQLAKINTASFITPTKKQKIPFSPQEDQIINYFVSLIGVKNWTFIEKFVPGRSAKQCRDRYMNYLKPGISNNEWTQKEDEILLQLYIKFGPKWATINKFFQNRNQIQLKNRLTFLKRHNIFQEKNSFQSHLNEFKNERHDPIKIEKPNYNDNKKVIANDGFIDDAIKFKNDKFFSTLMKSLNQMIFLLYSKVKMNLIYEIVKN